jgi:CRP-like cAMP-binding protein
MCDVAACLVPARSDILELAGQSDRPRCRPQVGSMDDKYWYLKSCELFERLTPTQAARLESRAKARKFARGDLIYLPADRSDCVLLVVTGRIKIYHLTGEGKQALLALIDPGELFGELSLLGPDSRDEFAAAMEPSTIVLIPSEDLQQLMQEHPGVSLGVNRLLGMRRQRIERRLKSLLFRSNRERLVHLLLELAEKYGRTTQEGVVLGIRLSHQDLASIIGSTRETVTVVLGELQDEGALIVRRRQIVVKQLERLAIGIGARPPSIPEQRERRVPVRAPVRVDTWVERGAR